MRRQVASTVRSAALRSRVLSLTNLLDRLEIGTVGRQEEEACRGSPDRGADSLSLVAAKIVHHSDVTRTSVGPSTCST